ncbi:MAG: arsenite methyltransferase [bacterium]
MANDKTIKQAVKEHYAALITKSGMERADCGCAPSASSVQNYEAAHSCCAPAGTPEMSYAEKLGYHKTELAEIPREAVENTFGCGAPLEQVAMKEGDVVLDLGSGAGLDVLIASRKVGQSGKVIGIDMTPEMIQKAEENARKAGVNNVEFRLGEMENMPVEDDSVDWIISNCVINLSPDKPRVFREAFRVLKPSGKMVISDMVAEGLSQEVRSNLAWWAGCVGGALSEPDYLRAIQEAGFREVKVLSRFELSREIVAAAEAQLPNQTRITFDDTARIASIKVQAVK